MTEIKYDPTGWHGAGVDLVDAWQDYERASTIPAQVAAFEKLSNAMSAIKSWVPGWDYEYDTMPWDRGDKTYYDRLEQEFMANDSTSI